MKLLLNIGMAAAILSTISMSPAFSQEASGERPGGRSLSVGIGFPNIAEPLRGRVGVGISALPDYEGSDDYSAAAFPLIDIEKPGTFFVKGASINTNDGLASAGITVFHITYSGESNHNTQLLFGPLIRVYRGRDEDDNEILNDMGNIDASAGVGGFMTLSSGPLWFNLAAATQDAGDNNDGLLVTLDAAYTSSVSNQLALSSGLSTSWADDDYMQGYFGVTNTQAANTGLTQFNGKAGFKDIGVNFRATYTLSKQWIIDGQVGYWRLLNDAADSPIVDKEGSANQVRGLVGLSYQF